MSPKLSLSAKQSAENTLSSKVKSFSVLSVMGIVYGLVCTFLGMTIALSKVSGYSIAVMVRDPNFVLDGHPIIGVQSHLGVLAWFAGACVCLFCYGLFRQTQRATGLFFLSFGLVTLWLTLDDLFLVHEYLSYEVLDVSESRIYAVYVAVLAGCFFKFRRYIRRSRAIPVLLAAIVFFGLSIFSDLAFPEEDAIWRIFLEDGFKLFGIVSWSSYFILNGFWAIAQAVEPSSSMTS